MRVVVGIIAALLTLGLAAFGVVAAQKEDPAHSSPTPNMSFHRRKQRTRRRRLP